jgi:hypothetical protein
VEHIAALRTGDASAALIAVNFVTASTLLLTQQRQPNTNPTESSSMTRLAVVLWRLNCSSTTAVISGSATASSDAYLLVAVLSVLYHIDTDTTTADITTAGHSTTAASNITATVVCATVVLYLS